MNFGVGVQHFAQGFAGVRPLREGTWYMIIVVAGVALMFFYGSYLPPGDQYSIYPEHRQLNPEKWYHCPHKGCDWNGSMDMMRPDTVPIAPGSSFQVTKLYCPECGAYLGWMKRAL